MSCLHSGISPDLFDSLVEVSYMVLSVSRLIIAVHSSCICSSFGSMLDLKHYYLLLFVYFPVIWIQRSCLLNYNEIIICHLSSFGSGIPFEIYKWIWYNNSIFWHTFALGFCQFSFALLQECPEDYVPFKLTCFKELCFSFSCKCLGNKLKWTRFRTPKRPTRIGCANHLKWNIPFVLHCWHFHYPTSWCPLIIANDCRLPRVWCVVLQF